MSNTDSSTASSTLAARPTLGSRRAVERAAWATMALFFVNGATFATWGVHIPTIKARFALTDAALSVAMFVVAGGAILAMGPTGRWVARAGSARACLIGGVACALAAASILAMPSYGWLLPALLAFGMSNAVFDVAMNAQAATVEASRHRPIMSALHGMFSLGGMVGAAVGGLMLGWDVPPFAHAAGMAVVTAATAALALRWLLPDLPLPPASEGQRPQTARALWLLGALAFLGLVGEGAMYDWTTVYMREIVAAPAGLISMGYAAFSGGMAVGRFTGDRVRGHWGDAATLTASAWIAFAGITLALVLPEPIASLGGFALMGLGAANMVPVFFVAASRLPGMAPAEAIAQVARLAYIGLMLGPVLIGGLAHLAGLRIGLAIVAVTMGWIAIWGVRIARPWIGQPEHRATPAGGTKG